VCGRIKNRSDKIESSVHHTFTQNQKYTHPFVSKSIIHYYIMTTFTENQVREAFTAAMQAFTKKLGITEFAPQVAASAAPSASKSSKKKEEKKPDSSVEKAESKKDKKEEKKEKPKKEKESSLPGLGDLTKTILAAASAKKFKGEAFYDLDKKKAHARIAINAKSSDFFRASKGKEAYAFSGKPEGELLTSAIALFKKEGFTVVEDKYQSAADKKKAEKAEKSRSSEEGKTKEEKKKEEKKESKKEESKKDKKKEKEDKKGKKEEKPKSDGESKKDKKEKMDKGGESKLPQVQPKTTKTKLPVKREITVNKDGVHVDSEGFAYHKETRMVIGKYNAKLKGKISKLTEEDKAHLNSKKIEFVDSTKVSKEEFKDTKRQSRRDPDEMSDESDDEGDSEEEDIDPTASVIINKDLPSEIKDVVKTIVSRGNENPKIQEVNGDFKKSKGKETKQVKQVSDEEDESDEDEDDRTARADVEAILNGGQEEVEICIAAANEDMQKRKKASKKGDSDSDTVEMSDSELKDMGIEAEKERRKAFEEEKTDDSDDEEEVKKAEEEQNELENGEYQELTQDEAMYIDLAVVVKQRKADWSDPAKLSKITSIPITKVKELCQRSTTLMAAHPELEQMIVAKAVQAKGKVIQRV
jgi:hypothetical protein